MGGFVGKAVAVAGLFVLFVFIYHAFDTTAPDREAAYQQAYDDTQARIRDSYELGETETGISSPGSDRDRPAPDPDARVADDWGGGNSGAAGDDWGE